MRRRSPTWIFWANWLALAIAVVAALIILL